MSIIVGVLAQFESSIKRFTPGTFVRLGRRMEQMYFQFSPIKYGSWKLEQNQPYTLKYRLFPPNGEITSSEAKKMERLCQHFGYDNN